MRGHGVSLRSGSDSEGVNNCDEICENLPYGGANIVGPDQTPRVMRGV